MQSNEKMKRYKERNLVKLGEFYTGHLMAMASENLDSKSDIAAKLAIL